MTDHTHDIVDGDRVNMLVHPKGYIIVCLCDIAEDGHLINHQATKLGELAELISGGIIGDYCVLLHYMDENGEIQPLGLKEK